MPTRELRINNSPVTHLKLLPSDYDMRVREPRRASGTEVGKTSRLDASPFKGLELQFLQPRKSVFEIACPTRRTCCQKKYGVFLHRSPFWQEPAPGQHLERDPTTNRPAAAFVKGVCRAAHDAPRRKDDEHCDGHLAEDAGNSSSASPDNVVVMRGSLKVPNDNKVRVAVAEADPTMSRDIRSDNWMIRSKVVSSRVSESELQHADSWRRLAIFRARSRARSRNTCVQTGRNACAMVK